MRTRWLPLASPRASTTGFRPLWARTWADKSASMRSRRSCSRWGPRQRGDPGQLRHRRTFRRRHAPLTAETHVETGAHDALGLRDVGECRTQPGDLRRESNLASAEVVIVVFDEAGDDLGEGVFTADPDRPSRPRHARGIRGPEDDRRRPIIVALPGAAALDVAEEAIPGVADAAGDRRQRPDLAVIGNADLARAVVAALGIRPGIVALEPDHKAARELIVATALHAAKPAMLLMSAERLAEKRATGRAHNPVLLLRPQAARMTADVAAGPAPNRDGGRRCLVQRGPHVGRHRWSHQCNQGRRSEQDFPHDRTPAS